MPKPAFTHVDKFGPKRISLGILPVKIIAFGCVIRTSDLQAYYGMDTSNFCRESKGL